MAKKQNIVFRRIKGRIVPIKLNKEQKRGIVSAGLFAGALGVSELTGITTAKMLRAAKKETAVAGRIRPFRYGQQSLFPHLRKMEKRIDRKRFMLSEGLFEKSGKRVKFALKANRVGSIVTAALVGLGIEQTASALGASELESESIGLASGIGADVLINQAFKKRFHGVSRKKAAFHSVKSALKKGAKFALKTRFKF